MHASSCLDAAQGALLGVACGDAAGGVLEFSGRPSPSRAAEALTMPGGGVMRLGRGQFTDDTELTLSLANGLLLHEGLSQSYPAEQVAQQYFKWYQSDPADIGTTTEQAFNVDPEEGTSIAEQMMEASACANQGSKSNGALMRVAPIAIFGCHMPMATLTALAKQDARLSHPNRACQSCNAVYCAAMGHLIAHPGDRSGAIEVATAVAQDPGCDPDVRRWLMDDSLGNPEAVDADSAQIGFCRWGFTLAFAWLRKGVRFEVAIEKTLLLGGDTDTNAAIVGGLLGAYWGAQAIPVSMSSPVLCYKYDHKLAQGNPRPDYLEGSRILPTAEALLNLAERLQRADAQGAC